MQEHEQLKWIADKIGYESIRYKFKPKYLWYIDVEDKTFRRIDVREIIFTPEFRVKCIEWIHKYRHKEDFELSMQAEEDFDNVMQHLDKPVEYIYNLLKEWYK